MDEEDPGDVVCSIATIARCKKAHNQKLCVKKNKIDVAMKIPTLPSRFCRSVVCISVSGKAVSPVIQSA